MTTLPEAVEQAIHAADETNTRIAEAANGSDLTDLYTEWGEALIALRSAILAYGAARERQGIERAVTEADRIADRYASQREATLDEDFLTRYWAAHAVAESIRALPVDGATP